MKEMHQALDIISETHQKIEAEQKKALKRGNRYPRPLTPDEAELRHFAEAKRFVGIMEYRVSTNELDGPALSDIKRAHKKVLQQVFEMFDADNTHYLDRNEVQQMARQPLRKQAAEELRKLKNEGYGLEQISAKLSATPPRMSSRSAHRPCLTF